MFPGATIYGYTVAVRDPELPTFRHPSKGAMKIIDPDVPPQAAYLSKSFDPSRDEPNYICTETEVPPGGSEARRRLR
jgi:hypothetical protein